MSSKFINWVLVIIGVIYLLNFTAGFIEFLPDNIPFIGNIDEGIAGAMIFQGLKNLGILGGK